MRLLNFGKRTQADNLSDDDLKHYRDYLTCRVEAQVLHFPPFAGLSWQYFLPDVELEALAARIKTARNNSIASVSHTIAQLPPAAVSRLTAAHAAYFTPGPPEDEHRVEEELQRLEPAEAKRIRQRRQEWLAAQALENKRWDAECEVQTQEMALMGQWQACPRAKLSTEPKDFLHWIKAQTPDTWHVVVQGWDYNTFDRDEVVDWIFGQPQCDTATVADFFYKTGPNLLGYQPEELTSGYGGAWKMTQRVAAR